MTRDRGLLGKYPQAADRAHLPGLTRPKEGDWKSLLAAIDDIHEHLRTRQGTSRNPLEASVTRRELKNLTGVQQVVVGGTSPGTVMLQGSNGSWFGMSIDAFAETIRNTKLYKDLLQRIDDPKRFQRLSKELQDILLPDLNELAAQRGADIRTLETKMQTGDQSLAQRVTEITAAVDKSTAGIRQTMFTQATHTYATAAYAIQITARLDDVDGGGASIEEVYTVTADRLEGLEAQWTLKANAGGAFAAIGLAATESTAGVGDSAIILVANKVAFVGPDEVVGTGPGEIDPTSPDPARIAFGVDLVNNVVYINGQVRINAGGTTLDDLAATTGIYISYDSAFFKVDGAGAAINSTVTLTANFTAGLSGTVTWTKSGTSTAPPAAGTSNTYTINAADQTDDTCTYTATYSTGGTDYTDSITIVRLRDGSNALTGLLTNESHTVPSDSNGVVSDYTGAGGVFKVYRGLTDVSSSCAFSIPGGGNPSGLTASIHATTGVYSATASGSWPNGTKTATITFRATISGVNIDKVFTITKANAGTNGTNGVDGDDGAPGARGPIGNGQGAAFGISTSAWSDGLANRVVRNIVMGENLTTSLASSALNVIGDIITLSNSTSFAQTRYWSGTAWVNAGVVVQGNLFVSGTVSGSQINGSGMDAGPGHQFNVDKTTGQASILGGLYSVATFGNLYDPTRNPILASGTAGSSQSTIKATAAAGAASKAIEGAASTSSTAEAILGTVPSANASASAHAVRGTNNHTGSSALLGPANGFDVYAEGSGTNYGPFTGAHDALLAKDEPDLEQGDIVVDVQCVARKNVSGTLFIVTASTAPRQKSAIGVLASQRRELSAAHPPAALIEGFTEKTRKRRGEEPEVTRTAKVHRRTRDLAAAYDRIAMNGLGEGQLNVCGEGGLELRGGDLIVTSSMRGKGMLQALTDGSADDIVRSYTVAKVRGKEGEVVAKLKSATDWKMVPCIFLAS
jgi:hypothetical protein